MGSNEAGPDPGNSGPSAWSQEMSPEEMADQEDLLEALRLGYIVMEPGADDGL